MRRAILLVLLSPALLAQENQPDRRFESLLTRFEKQLFDQASKYQEEMQALRQVLDRYAKIAKGSVKHEDLDQTKGAVQAIEVLCLKGMQITGEVTNPKVLRSRSARRMEIRLRKMMEELENLRKASPAPLWEVFDATLEKVSTFRDQLLEGIFKSKTDSSFPLNLPPQPVAASLLPMGTGVGGQTRIRSSITGDQFTDVEYEKIQDAQELKLRVKVFLGIAEARLDEIERRTSGVEWDKEEQNPLEFYTYAQLVRAYQRSLEGIMINIDERVTYKTATEKDIRKSLGWLNSNIKDFMPRLEPVKELSRERQDEDLYVEWRKAWKSSQTALEGSQLGLGDGEKP